jgi:hypothetical protein
VPASPKRHGNWKEDNMTPGTLLALAALLVVAGTLAWYYPKIQNVTAPLRPWREQTLMGLALLLAGGATFLHPGVFGYLTGGLAVLLAGLFLLLTFTSGLPDQPPPFAVGDVAPDFSAYDAEGRAFRLSQLRGSPVLLKFFRGHW